MEVQPIHIAIVDDHQIVIDGIKSLLHNHPRIKVILSSTDANDMLKQLETVPIHVLLTDIMMPGTDGIKFSRLVHTHFPEIKIMALSMSGDGETVNRLIEESNIVGYMLKNTGKKDLIYAIERIAAGGVYFNPEVLKEMEKAELKPLPEAVPLTAREIEIICLIEKELSNKQIAETLFISERTVETHRKNIFRKTQVSSLIGLIKYAYEHKLVKLS